MKKKVQYLIAKGQVYLYSSQLSPFDHIYWFDQSKHTFLPDLLTKLDLDKISINSLVSRLDKLQTATMFDILVEDWEEFMSNKICLPKGIDFNALRIDKKSPIFEDEFHNSLTNPNYDEKRYYLFYTETMKNIHYTSIEKELKHLLYNNTITPEKELIWDHMLDRKRSIPEFFSNQELTHAYWLSIFVIN